MSGVGLMLHVGGTAMVVDMHDHFRRQSSAPIGFIDSIATCVHCGALTVDYEVHLVWHITVIKDLSLALPGQTGQVMPQDVEGDEVGAPERNLRACRACGHVHLGAICDQPWRGNSITRCTCTVEQ